MTKKQKGEAYTLALKQLESILRDESHMILKMSTINCILRDNLPYYFWTGFYLVHKGALIVGPYQGSLGCLHIPFGKGVCGTAAQEKKTLVIKNVNIFPGHIACDSRSQSEIVLPVFNKDKKLIAVFDVDSIEQGSFDEVDKKYLEILMLFHFAKSALEI